jgi:ElaB/YqjD/DUF883 family membrane-anchored ribosome-binding protein
MQSNLYSTSETTSGGEPLAESLREGTEELGRLSGTAREVVGRVRDRASALTERVAGDSDRLYENAREWIVSHPMQALGGALAAGLLIGLLTRSRRVEYDE